MDGAHPDRGMSPGSLPGPGDLLPQAPEASARRIPVAPWRPVEALLVALAGFGLGAVLSMFVSAVVTDRGLRAVLVIAMFGLSLGAATVAWVAILHPGGVRALGLGSRRPIRDLAMGLLAGVALYVLTVRFVAPLVFTIVSLFTGGEVTPPQQDILPSHPERAEIVVAGISAIVAAPIGEELFFRGFLFGALRRRLRFLGAAPISAAAFGLVHVLPLLIPLMFVVGLGLASLYERRGSLLASIAAHAAFNVIGFTLLVLTKGMGGS